MKASIKRLAMLVAIQACEDGRTTDPRAYAKQILARYDNSTPAERISMRQNMRSVIGPKLRSRGGSR